MPEYSFSLTRYFPYKDRIVDSVFIQEYTSQRKPVFTHILRSDSSGVALKKILFGELFGKVFMRNAIFSKVTVLMFPWKFVAINLVICHISNLCHCHLTQYNIPRCFSIFFYEYTPAFPVIMLKAATQFHLASDFLWCHFFSSWDPINKYLYLYVWMTVIFAVYCCLMVLLNL